MRLLVHLCLALAAASAWARVEVKSPVAKVIEVAPGGVVTASVVTLNHGGAESEFEEEITLPPGCLKVAPSPGRFTVPAGGKAIRVLAVAIPAEMPAGRFEIGYKVREPRSGGAGSSASLSLGVQVIAVDGLDFTVEPLSRPILAGDAYPVKLSARNRGNSPVKVKLAHRSSLGFAVKADASTFELKPGASREIQCVVETDAAVSNHTTHAVTFDVVAVTASGSTLTASQASVAEIIPIMSGRRDPYHKLPMRRRVIGIAESGRDGQMQMEISGAGTLDEEGRHRVDFILRGPDIETSTFFGERDEIGASYQGENWGVDIGDRIYSLSPLTEKHTLGRGAGVSWRNEDTAAGMFYATTRYRHRNSSVFGAYARREVNEEFSLSANFLRKTDEDSPFRALPQSILSLEGNYHPGKALNLSLEAGVSLSDSRDADWAGRVEAKGILSDEFRYELEYVHAGPDFHGYYNNTDSTRVSLDWEISPAFRWHAALNHYEANPAISDARSSVVNRESSWNTGAHYLLTKNTEISLAWQHVQREDILLPAAYDFTEDSIRLGFKKSFKKLQFSGSADFGTLDNPLAREDGSFTRYAASLTWNPSPSQSYSVFAGRGPSPFSGSSDRQFNAGASARWRLHEKLTANVSVGRSQYDGLTGNEQDQAFAILQYQFENKNSLSLTGRWARNTTRRLSSYKDTETAVMAVFTMPFDRPVSRKRSIGALEGVIVCADKNGGAGTGVPRAVVKVDNQFAVTDAAGRFEFPSLKPGSYDVKVVTDSLDSRLTMLTPMPAAVTIHPAETTRVKLVATVAASVSVTVKRYEFSGGGPFNADGEMREAGGESAMIVELTNGRDTWRAQTDRLGCATFERLPEGRWTLRVGSIDPIPLHTIESPERELTLKPGEDHQVTVRVLPRRRTLLLLDQGTIR